MGLAHSPANLYYQAVKREGSVSATRGTPKYKQIYDSLQKAISSGRYAPRQRLPSESELVAAHGASRITVNRALRDLQVEGVIERRAGSGSFVKPSTTMGCNFGLLIPELGETEIFEPICRGMVEGRARSGHVLMWGQPVSNADAKEPLAEDLCHQFIAKKVAGVFFAPLELTPGKDAVNRRIAGAFDRAGIPVVLLDRDLDAYPKRSRYDLIGIDNRRAGYAITLHLIGHGCRRVVFIGRQRSAATVEARISGYREALHDGGLETNPDYIRRIQPWDEIEVRRMVKQIRPDGIVCANDFTAAHILRTFGSLGIRVPDDVRIVGIDDVKYASLLPVPLTTIHQPCHEIGSAAMAAMSDRLANPDLPARDILLDFGIVVRKSCGGDSGG
jgi:DNA-binding LacI/PurR family transcriptional regulator